MKHIFSYDSLQEKINEAAKKMKIPNWHQVLTAIQEDWIRVVDFDEVVWRRIRLIVRTKIQHGWTPVATEVSDNFIIPGIFTDQKVSMLLIFNQTGEMNLIVFDPTNNIKKENYSTWGGLKFFPALKNGEIEDLFIYNTTDASWIVMENHNKKIGYISDDVLGDFNFAGYRIQVWSDHFEVSRIGALLGGYSWWTKRKGPSKYISFPEPHYGR